MAGFNPTKLQDTHELLEHALHMTVWQQTPDADRLRARIEEALAECEFLLSNVPKSMLVEH